MSISVEPLLAWTGPATDGRIQVRLPDGTNSAFTALPELAAHLRQRGDPWGGFTACAAALGIALHACRRLDLTLEAALDDAARLLCPLPVTGVVARLRACGRKHADILGRTEIGARLVLEARRIQREQVEAVARAIESARDAVAAFSRVLVAGAGGSACDLGSGLLTGVVIAAGRQYQRAEDVAITGPPAIAAAAVADLAATGVPAIAVNDDRARAIAGSGSLGLLLRGCGATGFAETGAAELATLARRHNQPVIVLGVLCDPPTVTTDLAPLPSGCQHHVITIPVPVA